MSELNELKAKFNKTNKLLEKLDKRVALGEISEVQYKNLSEKYIAEAENLKNQIAEKELLQEVGLEAGEKEEHEIEYEQKEIEEEVKKETKVSVAGVPVMDIKTVTEEKKEKKGSITSAFLWMLLISIVLFWLPILGTIIAGFVGGRKAGSVGRAIIAALIPTIIMSLLVSTVLASIIGGIFAAIIGGGVAMIMLIYSITLIAGAILGALTSK